MLAQMAEVKHRREGHPESETSRAEHEGDRIRPRVTGFSGVNAVVSVSLSPGTAPARLIVSASPSRLGWRQVALLETFFRAMPRRPFFT